MTRARWLLLVFALTGAWSGAQAHPLAPALLELKELEAGRYAVLWRTSVARVQGAEVYPQLPPECRPLTDTQLSAEENQSQVLRWEMHCGPEGLTGRTLAVAGLDRGRISVILRIQPLNGVVITRLLDMSQPSFTVPALQARPPVFGGYFGLGVEHLLLGLDHVLFVLGLVLLILLPLPRPPPPAGEGIKNNHPLSHAAEPVRNDLPPLLAGEGRGGGVPLLVWTITAFTLGHSVTLALATLGFVRINPALTELAIAVSIIVLALELVRPRPESLFRRRPWLIALGFGLLHGLGFAGALTEVGLPQGEIPLALLAFNLGIEAGQLLLVATLLFSLSLWERVGVRVLLRRWLSPHPRSGQASRLGVRGGEALLRFFPAHPLPEGEGVGIAAAYLIGSLAAFWCIERAFVLFG